MVSTRGAEGVMKRPVVYRRPVRPPSAPPAPFLWAPVHWQERPVASRGVAPRPPLSTPPAGRARQPPQRGAPHPAPPPARLVWPTPATQPP